MSEVVRMLREDHRKVQGLFEQFESAKDTRKKAAIATQAIREIEVHATIEEEIVYPVLREADEDMFQEAQEEHHVVKILIAELQKMDPDAENFEAKFKVLSENVKHHIEEEEGEMLPALEKTDFDAEAMTEQMEARKEELMESAAGNGQRRAKKSSPTRTSSSASKRARSASKTR
jgi:hemerythrin superfamily protein